MTRFHPDRWQNVAPGAARTNASQSDSWPIPRDDTVTTGGSLMRPSGDIQCSRDFGKCLIHPTPGEIPEQSAKSMFHLVEIQIMAQTGLQGRLSLPGLPRVDFPGVAIEDTGATLMRANPGEGAPRERIRKQSEIAA